MPFMWIHAQELEKTTHRIAYEEFSYGNKGSSMPALPEHILHINGTEVSYFNSTFEAMIPYHSSTSCESQPDFTIVTESSGHSKIMVKYNLMCMQHASMENLVKFYHYVDFFPLEHIVINWGEDEKHHHHHHFFLS